MTTPNATARLLMQVSSNVQMLWAQQVQKDNPRLHEGVLRNGFPFSKDPLPRCVDGTYAHAWRTLTGHIGGTCGISVCTTCGLGSTFDSGD